jgi:hypothetical protein
MTRAIPGEKEQKRQWKCSEKKIRIVLFAEKQSKVEHHKGELAGRNA